MNTMTRVCPDCGEDYEVSYGEGVPINLEHVGCKKGKKAKKKSAEVETEEES